MSEAENTPVSPEKEEKPAPVVEAAPVEPAATTTESKPETTEGNGETIDNDVKEESENEAPAAEKPTETPMEVETEKPKATEKPAEPEKPVKKAEESPKKSPAKGEDDAEEEEEEESDEEPPLGLLERPVEVSGKRERKKVERLTMSGTFTPTDKKIEVPEGTGTKLGECLRIEFFISRASADECKVLHRAIFGRPGSATMVRKNLRKFCGFSYSEGSPEYEKKKTYLTKLPIVQLKQMASILDLERGGSRPDIATRIIDFLINPQDSGRPVPQKKARSKGVKAGAKRKRPQKTKKKKKAAKSDDEGDDDDDDEEDDDDDDEASDVSEKAESDEEPEEEEEKSDVSEDSDDAEEDEDSEAEKPKKKKARVETPKKKKPTKTATAKPKKEKKKKETKEKPKKKEKAAEKKKAAPKKKKVASSDDSSDDDEPLEKKAKKGPPTNDELKDLVKAILDGANLEEVTMKTVCKQVYAKYPNYDLTDRKDFIKTTVKNLIS